jgi:hypothetical protein
VSSSWRTRIIAAPGNTAHVIDEGGPPHEEFGWGSGKFQSVDDYVGARPEVARAILARVRAAIRKSLPGAEETISYNISAYKLRGSRVIYFAAWKKHFSLDPASASLIGFSRTISPRRRSARARSAFRSPGLFPSGCSDKSQNIE